MSQSLRLNNNQLFKGTVVRAFDPETKQWRTDYVITPNGGMHRTFRVDNGVEYMDFYEIVEQVNWKLSRFTGLHDKNGNEIYEGDIVRYPEYYFYDHLMPAGIEVIEWEGNGFNELLWFGYGNYPAWVEVIGNIYENPELLEV